MVFTKYQTSAITGNPRVTSVYLIAQLCTWTSNLVIYMAFLTTPKLVQYRNSDSRLEHKRQPTTNQRGDRHMYIIYSFNNRYIDYALASFQDSNNQHCSQTLTSFSLFAVQQEKGGRGLRNEAA